MIMTTCAVLQCATFLYYYDVVFLITDLLCIFSRGVEETMVD